MNFTSINFYLKYCYGMVFLRYKTQTKNSRFSKHEDIIEEGIREAFDGFSITRTQAMNEFSTNEITHRELGVALTSMAWGKALGHDGISIEFFQELWSTLGS